MPVDKLDVTVSRGWVTLKGDLDWQFQRRNAERVVRRLAGVKGVTNLITVRPRIAPADVQNQIKQALERSVRTDAKRIQVEVERAAGMAPAVTRTTRTYGMPPRWNATNDDRALSYRS